MLAKGKIGAEEMNESSLNDPIIRKLQKKIKLEENQCHTNAFPAKRFASVVITLQSGDTLETENVEARGDVESPLSNEEIQTKFIQLTKGIISESKQNQLVKLIENLDKEYNIKGLLDLITGKPSY